MKALRRPVIQLLVIAWLCAVGAGAGAIYAYSTTPGPQRAAPKRWPSESMLATPSQRFTLVMFVHPECPCSRASLSELAAIAELVGDRAAIHVVFNGIGESWDQAANITGANRILDPLGAEASRFGAATSGHVVVYDARGAQRYAGGITGSRGHVGDNVGRQTVEQLLAGSSDGEDGHPVFGCGL